MRNAEDARRVVQSCIPLPRVPRNAADSVCPCPNYVCLILNVKIIRKMFWVYWHKVKRLLPVLSCILFLVPVTSEAAKAISSEDLLLFTSYKSKHCDTDTCKLPVTSRLGALMEFSYCPDNTCDNFSMPYAPEEKVFYDFVFMYLYYKSGYIYLKEVKENYWKEHINDIARKYVSGKKGLIDESVIDCVLKAMAERHDILVNFIRHDGNARFTENIELENCEWQ